MKRCGQKVLYTFMKNTLGKSPQQRMELIQGKLLKQTRICNQKTNSEIFMSSLSGNRSNKIAKDAKLQIDFLPLYPPKPTSPIPKSFKIDGRHMTTSSILLRPRIKFQPGKTQVKYNARISDFLSPTLFSILPQKYKTHISVKTVHQILQLWSLLSYSQWNLRTSYRHKQVNLSRASHLQLANERTNLQIFRQVLI